MHKFELLLFICKRYQHVIIAHRLKLVEQVGDGYKINRAQESIILDVCLRMNQSMRHQFFLFIMNTQLHPY